MCGDDGMVRALRPTDTHQLSIKSQRCPPSPCSRGCGTWQRILPRCRSLIPARVNTHGLTDDSMMVLNPMHLEAGLLIDGELHEHHWRKQGEYHGRRGGGGRAFDPGYLPVISAEIEADLLLYHP